MKEIRVKMRNGFRCSMMARLRGSQVHLLDLNDEVSLTNAVDHAFQVAILKKLMANQPPRPPYTMRWFLYHPDATVTHYHEGKFLPVQPQEWDPEFRTVQVLRYGHEGIYK